MKKRLTDARVIAFLTNADAERLSILVGWLQMDCKKAFYHQRRVMTPPVSSVATVQVYETDCSELKRQLCERIGGLDEPTQRLLLAFVTAIQLSGVDRLAQIPF